MQLAKIYILVMEVYCMEGRAAWYIFL
jgi:hypothetical protein